MVGVVDDVLADRAFIEERQTSAAELCTVADLASPAPHFVANALAAAALARSARRAHRPRSATGCARFRPDGHRIADVGDVDGVTWVDDSKATNPHAALSSLQAYDPVVWVAGGLAKGARFDDLVRAVRDRLRGVVLLGRDRDVIARGAFATRARCPGDRSRRPARLTRNAHGPRRRPRPRRSPSRATRCCWPRDARPWTCSRTTATRATRSPTPVRRHGAA